MRNLHLHATRPHMGVVKHLLDIVERAARHTQLRQAGYPFPGGFCGKCRFKLGYQRVTMFDAQRVGQKSWVLRKLRIVQLRAEFCELAVVAYRYHHGAVLRLKHLIRNDARVAGAHAFGNDAADKVVHIDVRDGGDRGVEQRHVDVLPDTGLLALGKRGHDREA